MAYPLVLDGFGTYTTAELTASVATWGGTSTVDPSLGPEPLGYVARWPRVLGACSVAGPDVAGDAANGYLHTVGDGACVGCPVALAGFAVSPIVGGPGPLSIWRLGVRVRVPVAPPPGVLVRLVTTRHLADMALRPGALRQAVDVDAAGYLHVNDVSGAYSDLVGLTPPLVSGTPLAFGAWTYLELDCRPAAAADGGFIRVFLNGALVAQASGVDVNLDLAGTRTGGTSTSPEATYFQLGGDPFAPRDAYSTAVDFDDVLWGSGDPELFPDFYLEAAGPDSYLARFPYGTVRVLPWGPSGPGVIEPDTNAVCAGVAAGPTPWQTLAGIPSGGDAGYVTGVNGINQLQFSWRVAPLAAAPAGLSAVVAGHLHQVQRRTVVGPVLPAQLEHPDGFSDSSRPLHGDPGGYTASTHAGWFRQRTSRAIDQHEYEGAHLPPAWWAAAEPNVTWSLDHQQATQRWAQMTLELAHVPARAAAGPAPFVSWFG